MAYVSTTINRTGWDTEDLHDTLKDYLNTNSATDFTIIEDDFYFIKIIYK